jgi:hypothetical protein
MLQNYEDPLRKFGRMWNVKVKLVPIIINVTGGLSI